MANIIIIGAGPIGSYAAIKLAASGHKITVIEKKKSPELNVCCTGIISKSCFEMLEPLSIGNLVFRNANSASFYSPSSRIISFAREEITTYVINRPLLNAKLADIAQSRGVNYLFSTMATAISQSAGEVIITAKDNDRLNTIKADILIIASGMNGNLCKQLGLGTIKEYVIGGQAQVSLGKIDEVEIYLDHKLAPGGFSWLVPTAANKGLAGLITKSNPMANLETLLYKLRNEGKIRDEQWETRYGLIPQTSLKTTYTDRILVVGAAAGQVKPITGGGIYFGLLCANIAIDTINKAASLNNFDKSVLSYYQHTWHKLLLNEIALGNLVQKIWSKASNNQIGLIVNALKKKNIDRIINKSEHFSFDHHSKLLLQTAVSMIAFLNRK
jgi:digeranylgeranylglycerophospholipid reductase